jgi:DNA-binding response OmpR family regulator
MKHVLVIDESPLLREYLRIKLAEQGMEATVAINALDGMSKIRTLMPDLVVLDYHMNRQSSLEVLDEKKKNPNTAPIPVVVTAQRIDQKRIIELVNYNVKKVFTKPIRIDAFFKTLSELLGTEFQIDTTPCIVEAHVNDDIVFVEIAQGLNREKMDLLRFKIVELLELYEIKTPKIIVMMSDLKLSYADGPNLQKLIDIILQASHAKHRHVRVLTNDDFIRKYIKGRDDISDIEVLGNLQYALDGLLAELDPRMEFGAKKAEIIGARVLRSTADDRQETVQLKFDAEARVAPDFEQIKESGKSLKIAAVDDDFVIQELLKTTFSQIGATVTTFCDGDEFLSVAAEQQFDLVFLDLLMPKVSGFEVLTALQERKIEQPVIVLSAVSRRDAVVQAFESGVKSYLVKPLKPEAILKKAVEILGPNF